MENLRIAIGSALAVGMSAICLPVLAQTPAAAPVPSAPASPTQISPSVYVVSGWQVQCAPGSSSALTCKALDQVTARSSNSVITAITVTLGPDGKSPFVLMQTPLGVAVDSPVKITTPSGANETLPFLTCTSTGCFARAPLSDPMLTAMRTANQMLTITYAGLNASGGKQVITTTLALDGFSGAYGKLH